MSFNGGYYMIDLNKILMTQEKKSGFFARLYKKHKLVKMGIIQKQRKGIYKR